MNYANNSLVPKQIAESTAELFQRKPVNAVQSDKEHVPRAVKLKITCEEFTREIPLHFTRVA